MNFTQIDFSQAWIRHSMFKTRLRAYLLSGTGDTASFTDSRLCSLGTWLEEVAVKYSLANSSVLEVSYLHAAVHNEAGKLITLYKQNQVEEARARLTDIEAMDSEIRLALEGLQSEITA